MKISNLRGMRSYLSNNGYSRISSNSHEKWRNSELNHQVIIPHGHSKGFSIMLARRLQKDIENQLTKDKTEL